MRSLGQHRVGAAATKFILATEPEGKSKEVASTISAVKKQLRKFPRIRRVRSFLELTEESEMTFYVVVGQVSPAVQVHIPPFTSN